MQKANTLIRTKLRLPFIRPGLVSRPRLQEQIAQGLCGPLTLITAPAGFGKTTLVASCVTACGMPVAWLSLDKNDSQPGRFLTYLIAALQVADERVGTEAAHLMAGIQPAQPEAVLTSLINDLDSIGTEIVLVLDDYQLISSQAVHEEVAFLLGHCPNTLHLVIATRSDPPLPLARLRARGQTVELRAADLRFTAHEAAQFLNEIMGLRLDDRSIAVLEERTEGWIAGLQMASLALQGSPSLRSHGERDHSAVLRFIEGFSGTNRFILDYLLEEVLASQPPEIQHFLLCTSILERMKAPLCDAILAGDDSAGGFQAGVPSLHASVDVLKSLERENLFLIALDDDDSGQAGAAWFRYHRLFADLLKVRLQQAHADLVPQLHIRASLWLEQNGFILEAVPHLFAAHEINQAADLIERHGPARWAAGDPSVIQMADGLPPEALIARPKIGLYFAWHLIILGHAEKALLLLNDMARHYASAEPVPSQRWIQTMIALALAFLGQRKSAIPFDPFAGDPLLDEIPSEETILRDTAESLYAMTLGRRGDLDRAVKFSVMYLARKSEQGRRNEIGTGSLAIPTLVPFLARIYLVQGHLHEAAALCRKYLAPLQERGIRFIYSAGSMNIVLGEVLFEWNCLEEAEKQIRDGIQANEPWVDVMSEAFGLIALTHVLQAKGDYAAALQTAEKLETRLQNPFRPYEFEEDYRTLRVRVQLASGDLQSPSLWAEQVYRSEDFQLHPSRYRFTLACIRLAQGRYDEMEELLSGALQADAGNLITRQLKINLMLALAAQQRPTEALARIETCLALAEPEGYLRPFLGMGEPIRDLLAAYLRSANPGRKQYAQKVLAAFSLSNRAVASGAQPGGLVEPITERELEVLQLMALGKTNQEIARQLVVAPGTVKAHAASIYRKLDSANRTEAVARARQLGILP